MPHLVERERFTALVEGSGPDVILIPGLSSSREVWASTRAALRENYRLDIVQLRGFGDAPGVNANGPVLEPFVEDLAGYIADNSLDHPAIIGHSMGGLAAMMIGARYPGFAGKLLIVDSLPYVGLIFDPDATVDAIQPQAEAIRQAMANNSMPANAAMFATMSNGEESRSQIADWANASDRAVGAQAFYDDMTADIRPELGSIAVPMTVLYPFDGSQGTSEEVDALYTGAFASSENAELMRIENSRHFIMLDRPERFIEEVRAFLVE